MDRVTEMISFVKVVECGGFSAAARRLGVSTSVVSTNLRGLEDRLGVRLLHRTTRKVTVTDVGHAYYERCARILAEIDEADLVAGEQQSIPRGVLRLNAAPALAVPIAPVIAQYLAQYPGTSVKMTLTDRMVDMVEEGYDLAVRMTPPPESSLIIRRLTTYHFVLCAAPAYLKQRGAPSRPADLASHNCLRYTYFPFGDEWRFTGPDGAQSVRIAGNLECNSGETLRMAAMQGQGIMLAPRFLVEEQLRLGKLVPIMRSFEPVDLSIDAIHLDRHHVAAKVRTFIDFLVKYFTTTAGWNDDKVQLPFTRAARRGTLQTES